MNNKTRVLAAAMLASLVAGTVPTEASNRTRLGVLECAVEGGIGQIVRSSRKANCFFRHKDGTVEEYAGTLSKLGIDIGISDESYVGWIVYTPVGNESGSYALAGKYVGISAGGALGIGLGVNALVGGSDKKIGLRPFSAEGKSGLNVAAGLTSLTLEPVK